MSKTLYIPPKEISVRIVGLASLMSLLSRTNQKPYFWHHPLGDIYDDQWWHIVAGTGDHEGQYMIQSAETNQVIYSKADDVGTMESNGDDEGVWFTFEPGTLKRANYFRLVCPATSTAMVSRTNSTPQIWNYPSDSKAFDDQYFRFLFEDMAVKSVKFDIDAGVVRDSTPLVLARSQLPNDTSVDQKISASFKKAVENESSFEYALGFSVEVGTSFSCGVPMLAEGKLDVSLTTSSDFTWGKTTTETSEYSATFEVVAPPHSTVEATATLMRSEINVPFTMTLASSSTGYEVKTEGLFRGVTFYDLKCRYSEPKAK